MTCFEGIAEYDCGCIALSARNGVGDHFVVRGCSRHRFENRAGWADLSGFEPIREQNPLTLLCALNDLAILAFEGDKLCQVKKLLGIPL